MEITFFSIINLKWEFSSENVLRIVGPTQCREHKVDQKQMPVVSCNLKEIPFLSYLKGFF